jgi:hypothetical protein
MAAIDWDAAVTALNAGELPCSGGERRLLLLSASLAAGIFSPGELRRCWAAGAWTRAFDAKQERAAGQPITRLTQDEAHERLRRAGMH